jgi:hypothetical protein
MKDDTLQDAANLKSVPPPRVSAPPSARSPEASGVGFRKVQGRRNPINKGPILPSLFRSKPILSLPSPLSVDSLLEKGRFFSVVFLKPFEEDKQIVTHDAHHRIH